MRKSLIATWLLACSLTGWSVGMLRASCCDDVASGSYITHWCWANWCTDPICENPETSLTDCYHSACLHGTSMACMTSADCEGDWDMCQ